MPDKFTDTSVEELEALRLQKTKQRVRNLIIILVIAGSARYFIEDPPPYKAPDHSHANIQYLPGMLDAMSDSDKANLTPEMLAKFQEADSKARSVTTGLEQDWALSTYTPEAAPTDASGVSEADQELMFQYAKKRRRIEALREEIIDDPTKVMLVQFRKGGYIRATSTSKKNNLTTIRIHNTLAMDIPSRLIRSVKEGDHRWQPPVPKGYTRLKPAKGITVIVANQAAKRIKKRFS